MTTRKRLPYGAAGHMRRAQEAIAIARQQIQESRRNVKTNPALHDLMLADTEIYLADAMRYIQSAIYGAGDEEETC